MLVNVLDDIDIDKLDKKLYIHKCDDKITLNTFIKLSFIKLSFINHS